MPTIIPNWHPLLVHFPIALIAVSALFTLGAKLLDGKPLARQWQTVGHWTLWLAAVAALAAAGAGWFAFNSVSHDEAGHAAMLLHRGWALPTVAAITSLALWDGLRTRRSGSASWLFVALLWIAFAAVGATAWLGGELVYRHGLGVLALPQPHTDSDHHHADHHHDHGAEPGDH